ncbi:TPA: hypothetical protein N0F65_012738 [Lagenidium giganteum]|uniref:Polyprotein n=1 Tax=Lagenidium giganteum TaxID=4803 RepID=A0AAV2YEQ6_9STRA|nr:TPA: hypothetical protein N0F65_012738 [Lagenidium giganteum]
MTMKMANQAAIRQVEWEESSARARHIDVKLKFLKDYSKKGVIAPTYYASADMKADVLTKAFAVPRLQELRKMVGLV